MVEDKKLAVRKCGESARARLALESAGDLLQNKRGPNGLIFIALL